MVGMPGCGPWSVCQVAVASLCSLADKLGGLLVVVSDDISQFNYLKYRIIYTFLGAPENYQKLPGVPTSLNFLYNSGASSWPGA